MLLVKKYGSYIVVTLFTEMEEEISVKKTCTTSFKEKFRNEVILKMTELGLWKDGLEKEIPTYWDNFNNFVVFNRHFFSDSCWTEAGYQIWQCVSQVFSGKSIALQGKIQNDDYRSPTATLVYGESPWIRYTDNSVHYTWNVEFTMFCTGNVSERHRVAGFECQDKVVVDMFAGIGYFTLPFLVHAKAKQVIACEWNPVSVEALKRNLSINKMTERCTVLEGDVRNTCPRGVADHINLGLIPSCEEYWISAADILKPSGGVMHVHGNITSFTKGQHFSIECEMCLYLLQEMSVDYLTASIEHCLSDFKLVSGNKVSAEKTNGGNVKWKKFEWFVWGLHVSHSFCEHLSDVKKSRWTVQPSSLHRVKAYAPRIDHLVIDICCRSAE